MKYYINSGNRRKKNVFLIILITITIIGFITTISLVSSFFHINKMIEKNLVNIETVKQETTDSQKKMGLSKEKVELYGKKLDVLNEQLLRFEPVIIPDSMSKDKATTQ